MKGTHYENTKKEKQISKSLEDYNYYSVHSSAFYPEADKPAHYRLHCNYRNRRKLSLPPDSLAAAHTCPVYSETQLSEAELQLEETKKKSRITDIEALLLRQISFQVTDKMKAAYPEASWEFVKPPKAEHLLTGRAFRLRTFHTGDYNFAEVTLDRYGQLRLSMMTITALNPETNQHALDIPGTTELPDTPEHEDPEAWYSLIGKPLLTELIGDLQARGHQKLFINEAGDIFIFNGSIPEVKSTFPHFPSKDYWAALTDIFIQDELQAKETDNTLELSWI